jgi:phosphate transport system substrate-binding protein
MEFRISRVAKVVAPLAVVALVAAACSSSSSSSSTTVAPSTTSSVSGTLNGSGSTFQLAYQQQAIQSFHSIAPMLTVNYGGGGSGKGRTDLASGVVNYAGSDSPIPAADQSKFSGTVLYFPTVIGPITVSYNLSGVKSLQLDGPTLAKIFSGTITTWNDPAIKALNPNASLPSTPITIARRPAPSGPCPVLRHPARRHLRPPLVLR